MMRRRVYTLTGFLGPRVYLSHCQRCDHGHPDYAALSRKGLENVIDQETRALCDEGGLDFEKMSDRVAAQRAVFQNNRALRVAWASR